MKKFTFTFIHFLFAFSLMAQVPAGFSYQAVVRNTSGEVVANQTVKFKFSILQNSETGTPVYVETQSKATNDFGLANLTVGSGTLVSGIFNPATWGNNYHFLKVELDPNNGNTFSHLGTMQLMAVPYAFHAQTVAEISNNSVTSAKIASGAVTGAKIAQAGASTGQALKWNGTTWAPATDETGSGGSNPTGPAGGDLTGTYPNPTIGDTKITNAKIADGAVTAPKLASMGATIGQVLKFNGTTWSNATDEKGPWIETDTEILYTGTKNVGIGIGIPGRKLALAQAGESCYMSFHNSSTGFSHNDGLVIGVGNKDAYFFNQERGNLYFSIEGTSGITLTPSGFVGIGVLPLAGLHLKGTSFPKSFMYIESSIGQDAGIRLYEGSTDKWHIFNNSALDGLQIYNNKGNNAIFCKQSNSFVGLGTTAPTQKLHVVGNAYKTEGGTSWASSSDLRLKTVLGDYQKGLNEIAALNPVRFRYLENNPRELLSDIEQVGFVAQEVQKIFPEAVSEAEDGYLDFNIHSINIALVNAIKELKAENDQLISENEQFKSINREIINRLEKLETVIYNFAEN